MKSSSLTLVSSALLLAALGGCGRESVPKTEAAAPVQAAVPAPMGSMATGQVVETMDAANYTYVRIKTDAGEVWAAATQFKVAVGEKVTIPLDMPMENFNSPTLKRTFPKIYFTSRVFKEGEMPGMPAGH